MKTIIISTLFIVFHWPAMLTAQTFSFSMPNTSFVLIPGGGFETKAWAGVDPEDSVVLSAATSPGLLALFQPSVIYQDQFVYLVVISTDTALAPLSQVELTAVQNNDTIHKSIFISKINDPNGFNLYDSAWYYLDTAFQFLKASYPAQQAFFNSLHQLAWTPCFPYPPLLIVTHHLFVYESWRTAVMWHNMIPPYNWAKVFISNEASGDCWGVNIDTWGNPSLIPCETMHYNQQDSIVNIASRDDPARLTIWPNPSCKGIYIRLPEWEKGDFRPELRNAAGIQVQYNFITDSDDIRYLEMEGLPEGMYFISQPGQCGSASEKIIHSHCR